MVTYRELGRLLAGVCRLHHTRADQAMERIGLFRGQAFLLMILSDHEGMTHSEIAERLGVSAAATSKVIKRMEQNRYLERQADPDDERVSRVYLREKGRALIGEIQEAFGQVNREMCEGLAEGDLERLRDLLTRMQVNLQKYQV